jgi:hypothetical protein
VVAGGDRVSCELGELRAGTLGIELLERLDHALVEPKPARAREAVIERVPDQLVGEAKPTGRSRNLGHEARGDRLVEPFEQRVVGDTPDAGEHIEVELAPEHRGEHQEAAALLGKVGEPPGDDVANAPGMSGRP